MFYVVAKKFNRSDESLTRFKMGLPIGSGVNSRAIIKFSKNTQYFVVNSQRIDSKRYYPMESKSLIDLSRKTVTQIFLYRIISVPLLSRHSFPYVGLQTEKKKRDGSDNACYDDCKFDYLNKYSSRKSNERCRNDENSRTKWVIKHQSGK